MARTLRADVRGARDATEEVTCPQSLYRGLCESGYGHFLGWSGREWAGQPRRCGAEGLRSWWPVAPSAVGAALVVGPSPALDEDLGVPEGVEDLAVAQLLVEALDLPVCPGAAGLNEEGLGPNAGPPRAHGPGGELRAVVRAEVGRDARGHHEARPTVEHVGGVDVPSDLDGEPRARELVKHGQQVQRTPVMGPGPPGGRRPLRGGDASAAGGCRTRQ